MQARGDFPSNWNATTGQPEDKQAILVAVGREFFGQHAAGFPTVTEGASGGSPQKATGSIHASYSPLSVLVAKSQLTTGFAGCVLASRESGRGNPETDLKCGIKYATIYGMTTSVEELIQAATDARRIAQKAIQLAVREARAADWSWDQISAALGGKPNGETLRRNFGADE
jgi:hypothetical protein